MPATLRRVADIRNIARELAFGPGDTKAVGDLRAPAARAPEVFGVMNSPSSGRFSTGSAARMLETYASGSKYAIDWVFNAITLIAETAATADYVLLDPDASDPKPIPKSNRERKKNERLAPQDLVALLERPNPWTDRAEWLELLIVDWFLAGDHFSLLFKPDVATGRPLAMYRLPPQLVEVVPGEGELIKAYKYRPPGAGGEVEFDPEDVLHIRRPNPHDPYRGASIISAAPRVFEMEVALTDTQAAYYETGAKLTGVLESERSINDGVISKIRRQFMGLYGGTDNAYQVAVLERGLTFKPISNNAADAMFGEMTEQSAKRILAMLRTSPRMLGLDFGEGGGSEATEEDRRTFANGTMRPILNRVSRAITTGLVDRWDLEFKIEYEYQMPIEEQINLGSTFASIPGVRVREVREFMKLPPLGTPEDELILNLPGDDENESAVKDRNLGGEAGRPPNGENTATFDERNKKDDAEVRE